MASEDYFVLGAHAVDLVLITFLVRALLGAYGLSADAPLRRFATGFVLLGMSHIAAALLDVLTLGADLSESTFDHLDVLFWAYYACTLAGFASIFASFGRHPFRWTPALAPLLLLVGPVLEGLVILLLFFVLLHSGLNHIARARPGSLRTAIGFFCFLAAHFLFFLDYAPLTPRAPIGELPTTLGYALLLLSIARPRRQA